MVLDPGMESQVLLVEAVAPGGTLEGLNASLVELRGQDTVLVTSGVTIEGLGPCTDRYGQLAGWDFRCLEFDLAVEPGASYAVRVDVPDRPPATAAAVVPSPVEILEAEVTGDPPGTDGLTAVWSESAMASGYFVSVRPDSEPDCARMSTCPDGWFVATPATRIETVIPPDRLPDHNGSWILEVYAVDRSLFDHLTTGAGGTLFPVQPVQNVQGGFGAVGAWARAQYSVPRPAPYAHSRTEVSALAIER